MTFDGGKALNQQSDPSIFRRGVGILVGLCLLAGCSSDTALKKDPFFEKWKTLSETATGASPTATPRMIDASQIISKPGDEPAEALPAVTVKRFPTTKINLKMNQADVKAVLRSLALAAGLNILIKNEIKGEVSVDFRGVPWDQAFNGILKNQGLAYAPNPWDGGILRVISMEDQERDLKRRSHEMNARQMEPPVTLVVPIEYGKAKDIRDNLQEFLTRDKDGKAVGSIKVDDHSNSLIISAIRDDLDRMMAIIEKIDKPTHQILIRANIVEATKSTARDLGVQWGGMYSGTLDTRKLYVTPGGTEGATTTDPLTGAYTPLSAAAGISGQGFGLNFPAAAVGAAGGGSLGLLFGTIGGNILELQLQALQQDGKINILSSPSITTLDNQTAYTENGERVPYVSTSTSTTGTTQDVSFEDAVLRLEIKPHVIGNQYLKMDVLVKKNEVDTSRNVLGNPYIIKKETKTTLIVRDGETIVISGLTKQRMVDSESGLPWLKNIPGLSWLFKSTGKSEAMEEVLVFITPTILPPQTAAIQPPGGDNPAGAAR